MHKLIIILSLLLLYSSCQEDTSPSLSQQSSNKNITRKNAPDVIALVPVGNPLPSVLDTIKNAIEHYYGFNVEIQKPIVLPASFRSDRGPNRYRADSIIHYLQNRYTGFSRVVGVTDLEISTTKYSVSGKHKIKEPAWKYRDWGIFGLGFCPGRSCVVSYCYLLRREKSKMHERLRKISLHETGHTLGLPHCPDKNCVMTDACESIITVDKARPEICSNCRSRLK